LFSCLCFFSLAKVAGPTPNFGDGSRTGAVRFVCRHGHRRGAPHEGKRAIRDVGQSRETPFSRITALVSAVSITVHGHRGKRRYRGPQVELGGPANGLAFSWFCGRSICRCGKSFIKLKAELEFFFFYRTILASGTATDQCGEQKTTINGSNQIFRAHDQ